MFKLRSIINVKTVVPAAEREMLRGLYRAGGFLRKTARRSLKFARQKRIGELTEVELTRFRAAQRAYAEGKLHDKPRRPEVTAKQGDIPKLHTRPKSPLKERITFDIDKLRRSVVIGPELTSDAQAAKIEGRNPFMGPALQKTLPRLPDLLRGR